MKRFLGVLFCVFLFITAGCGNTDEGRYLKKDGYNIDYVTLEAGIEKPVRLVVVNDLHLQINNEEISEENREFMTARVNEFATGGVTTEKRWERLPKLINKTEADYVAFIGDIADFNSIATTEALKKGFSELNKPYMYLRADHDIEAYWQNSADYTTLLTRQAEICDFKEVFVEELDEIVLVGINMSQNNISEDTYLVVKEAMEIGKPVIILTHVPVAQMEGGELQSFSEQVRDGRRLYWGHGAMEPSPATECLLNDIYAEDSPVVAVLAAHIHGSIEVFVNENVVEHVFAPCYLGNIGIVTIE